MGERKEITIKMDVTIPQGLALEAMFKYWNYLANIGSSRYISFYVDGDGNFKPNCKISFNNSMPELTEELQNIAVVEEKNGARKYDFDPVAWTLRELNEA